MYPCINISQALLFVPAPLAPDVYKLRYYQKSSLMLDLVLSSCKFNRLESSTPVHHSKSSLNLSKTLHSVSFKVLALAILYKSYIKVQDLNTRRTLTHLCSYH